MYLSCTQNTNLAEVALAGQVSRCPSKQPFAGNLTFMRDLLESKQQRWVNKFYVGC